MRPSPKPPASSAARNVNAPQRLASSAPSTGSTPCESTSQKRKTRIPVATAASGTFGAGRVCRTRAIGRPIRIVAPAIPPSRNVSAVPISVRVTLHEHPGTMAGAMAGHSIDEYLETIYFLAFPIGEYRPQTTGTATLSSRIAEMLGVSRASAGEMLKRLEKEGLVERGEHKEAILTATGRVRAEKAVRKHPI